MDTSSVIVSDIRQCESQISFCTYTPFDKLNSTSAPVSDTTQCEDPNDFCTNISFDNLDNVSVNTIDPTPTGTEGTLCKFSSNEKNSNRNISCDSQARETPCRPSVQKPSDNPDIASKKLATSLNRNPPTLNQDTWEKYDNEYHVINQKAWDNFRKGFTTPEQFVSDLNGTLASFLESKEEFVKVHKEFFKHTQKNHDPLEDARKLKIELNKKAKLPSATKEDKVNAKEAIRIYSHALKVNKERQEVMKEKEEMNAYRKDFWKTAKQVTNGTFGESESKPTFNKSTADQFYKSRYENPTEIKLENLSWFPSIDPPTKEYNLTPFTPKDIKIALKKKDIGCSNFEVGYFF